MRKRFECPKIIFIGTNLEDMARLASHLTSLQFEPVMKAKTNPATTCSTYTIIVEQDVANEAQIEGNVFVAERNLDVVTFQKADENTLSF